MDREGAVACGCAPAPDLADWLRVGLGIVISGQLMVLSLAVNLSSLAGDAEQRVHLAIVGLTLLGVLLLGPELARGLRAAWRRREASLDAMFGLAFLGGLAASLGGLLTGGAVFFEVVTVVLCVRALGQRLQARFWADAFDRIEQAGLLPRTAHRLEADALRSVELGALRGGDRVVVYDGERVPASGVVEDGAAWVDTDGVDGDRVPRWVGREAEVPGGAAVRGGTLRIRVTEGGADGVARTRAALLSALSVAPADGLAARLAAGFVPVVAGVAVAAGIGWTAWSGVRDGFVVATAVLLVACPCGFGLATPVATWAAAARLAERGIRVRRPASLERLARVDVVVLDKTGTLTRLVPRTSGAGPDRVRRWVGAVQQWFDHPVARLLWSGGADAPAVRAPSALPGGGVSARVLDEGTWRAVRISPLVGRDLGVWVDGELASVLGVDERTHEGVPELLAALGSLGLSARILTGDALDPSLGIPCEGAASPSDKAHRVRALRADHGVAFVGDRPNDLPAMAEADVAIAVPGASELVSEASDLQLDDLALLPEAIRGARALHRRLRRLLLLSLAGNVVGISAAVLGLLHPVAAALIMALSSLTVTLLAAPRELP